MVYFKRAEFWHRTSNDNKRVLLSRYPQKEVCCARCACGDITTRNLGRGASSGFCFSGRRSAQTAERELEKGVLIVATSIDRVTLLQGRCGNDHGQALQVARITEALELHAACCERIESQGTVQSFRPHLIVEAKSSKCCPRILNDLLLRALVRNRLDRESKTHVAA